MLRIARKAAQATVLAVALIMVFLAVLSVVASGDPADSGTWRLGVKPMTVLGGSMEPAIHVGSLALIGRTDTSRISAGEVVTFSTPPGVKTGSLEPGTITTHRVVRIETGAEGRVFETKGDANEDPDRWLVPQEAIVGQPVLTIPLLGYLARWASSRAGFILLIVIPGVALIISELRRLRRPAAETATGETSEASNRA